MVSVSGTSFFFFSFTNNSLTFVAKCVRSGSPYALISGKFRFNILLQWKNITIYDTKDARGAISDRPCCAARFIFCYITNFHSTLSEHKAQDDNVNTRLLLSPVNKSQMNARLKCTNISYRLLKILRRQKDGQSIFDSSGGQNLEELSIIHNFKFIFSAVNGYSIVFRGITDSHNSGLFIGLFKTYFCKILLGLPLFPIYFILFKLIIIL